MISASKVGSNIYQKGEKQKLAQTLEGRDTQQVL